MTDAWKYDAASAKRLTQAEIDDLATLGITYPWTPRQTLWVLRRARDMERELGEFRESLFADV